MRSVGRNRPTYPGALGHIENRRAGPNIGFESCAVCAATPGTEAMWNFTRGVFYSLLPRTYWHGWSPNSTADLERSTIISGVLEFTVCAWLLVRNYIAFLVLRQRQLIPVAGTNSGTRLYFAGVLTIEYLLRPLSVVLAVFAVEGAVRAISAFLTEDALPTLPAKVVSSLQMVMKKRQAEKQMGPIVPDAVEWLQDSDYRVRISSSRPKEGWRSSVTVAINDELYDLVAEKRGTAPRSYVYLLRKQPADKIIRGLYSYEPGEQRLPSSMPPLRGSNSVLPSYPGLPSWALLWRASGADESSPPVQWRERVIPDTRSPVGTTEKWEGFSRPSGTLDFPVHAIPPVNWRATFSRRCAALPGRIPWSSLGSPIAEGSFDSGVRPRSR